MVAPGAALAMAAARSKLWGIMFWFPPNAGVTKGTAVVVGAAPGVGFSRAWVGSGLTTPSVRGLRLTSRTNRIIPTSTAPAMIRISGLTGIALGAASRIGPRE